MIVKIFLNLNTGLIGIVIEKVLKNYRSNMKDDHEWAIKRYVNSEIICIIFCMGRGPN